MVRKGWYKIPYCMRMMELFLDFTKINDMRLQAVGYDDSTSEGRIH